MKNAWWLIGVALGSSAAFAEPMRVVTLTQALEMARARQPKLKAAEARVQEAQAGVSRATAEWLPKIGIGAQLFGATENNTTATTIGRAGLDIPRIGSGKINPDPVWAPSASTFVGLGANQEVFDFGRIGLERSSADAHLDAARYGRDASWLDVSTQVELAFLLVRSQRELLATADQAVGRANLHRDYTRAGVNSGVRAQVDLSRVEADVAKAEVIQARASAGVKQAQAALGAAIGLDDAIDAGDDDTEVARPDALEQLLTRAERSYPALNVLRAEAVSSEQNAKWVDSFWRPDLGLTAGINSRAGGGPSSGATPYGDGWLPVVPNWDVGLVLSWSIYDPVQRAAARQAAAHAEAAQAIVVQGRQELLSNVRQAWLEATTARDVLTKVQRTKDAAVAASEQADARFKSGLGSTLEVLEAESFRSDAETQLVIAEFDVARTTASLQRMVGVPAGKTE